LSLVGALFVGGLAGKAAVVLVPFIVGWLYVRLRGGSMREATYLGVITGVACVLAAVLAVFALFAFLIVGCSIDSSGCGG
jgi:hypothetical protein